jgi:hypothetical protein
MTIHEKKAELRGGLMLIVSDSADSKEREKLYGHKGKKWRDRF